MALELLAIGDMHMGRRPSRLPGELAESGRSYGPAEAWTRAVRHAVQTGVDVVALAGDLVDQEDDFFEAYRVIYRTPTSYGSHLLWLIGSALSANRPPPPSGPLYRRFSICMSVSRAASDSKVAKSFAWFGDFFGCTIPGTTILGTVY